MSVIKKIRLWKAKWFGPVVWVWSDAPTYRNGALYVRRTTESGEYEYRRLNDFEVPDYLSREAW